jgi:lipopolysaccharide/colanic/teichoic acid biosynthesis glycosyltransferase
MNFVQSMLRKSSQDNGSGPGQISAEQSCGLLDETQFNAILALERKRSERSRRPFILMLLDISKLSASMDRAGSGQAIADQLIASTRETDAKGWDANGLIVGALFTELGEATVDEATEKIQMRVLDELQAGLDPDQFRNLKISFHVFPEAHETAEARLSADLRLYPDLMMEYSSKRFSLSLKRAIDITVSLLGLIVLSPLFVAISLWIRLTSKGPIFYRQKRVGQFGKRFVFLKFRSMVVDNDPSIHREYVKQLICSAESGQNCNGVYKIQHDPRITPVGKFIRKTSLDELPQLINVLKGEMSLVGPRPPIPYELEFYNTWHWRRILEMKPGITGLWQVKGRSSTTFDEMVRLDLRYHMQWSLLLDFLLLLQTPWVVLKGKGAY